MRPYLITAKPGRLARAASWAGRWSVRAVALAVMVGLGALVFVVRCARPVINYLAERAAFTELWASRVTGLPPVGASVGAGLTAEFAREFRNGWDTPAAETT